jgi:hypothetical protein
MSNTIALAAEANLALRIHPLPGRRPDYPPP